MLPMFEELYQMQQWQRQGNYIWILRLQSEVVAHRMQHSEGPSSADIGVVPSFPRKFRECSIKSAELSMVAVLSLNCPTVYSHSHSRAHRAAVDGRIKQSILVCKFSNLGSIYQMFSVLQHTERFPREQHLSAVLLPIFFFWPKLFIDSVTLSVP